PFSSLVNCEILLARLVTSSRTDLFMPLATTHSAIGVAIISALKITMKTLALTHSRTAAKFMIWLPADSQRLRSCWHWASPVRCQSVQSQTSPGCDRTRSQPGKAEASMEQARAYQGPS